MALNKIKITRHRIGEVNVDVPADFHVSHAGKKLAGDYDYILYRDHEIVFGESPPGVVYIGPFFVNVDGNLKECVNLDAVREYLDDLHPGAAKWEYKP